jgi:hypothetical protein
MEVSGSPHEGWMMFVPLTVLILIIMYVLGGPVQFMNTLTGWGSDLLGASVRFVKQF